MSMTSHKKLSGHLGAEHVWMTLRSESLKKLHVLDDKFPPELKKAVSAHVREGLTRKKKPVFRNFVVTEDVPEIKQLTDQSVVFRIRDQKHKSQIMYQSSQKNYDRSRILLFNNPLPTLSEDGLKHFIPSFKESSESYSVKKSSPTSRQSDVYRKSRRISNISQNSLDTDTSETLQDIWRTVLAQRYPRKVPRYHFLTERESTVKGEFQNRLKKNGLQSNLSSVIPAEAISKQDQFLESNKNKSVMTDKTQKELTDSWEPISLHALTEYKTQKCVKGFGDFQHGKSKVWKCVE